MKTIKLLICVLLTTMSFNVFADEGRYQMVGNPNYVGVYVLDTKTGAMKYCTMSDPKIGVNCIHNVFDTKGIQRKSATP